MGAAADAVGVFRPAASGARRKRHLVPPLCTTRPVLRSVRTCEVFMALVVPLRVPPALRGPVWSRIRCVCCSALAAG